MKHIKKYFAAATLATVLAFGSGIANAGIIVAGAVDYGKGEPTAAKGGAFDYTMGITGIIVAGFYGIIVAGAPERTNDGIIVAG
jgi:hypothetical protein